MNIKQILLRAVRKIPLFGSLVICRPSDHREAFQQLSSSLAISMAPVYIGAFSLCIYECGGTSESYADFLKFYVKCLHTIVHNGELFIYAAAVLAPVMYIVSRDRSDGAQFRSFPSKFTFIIAVMVVTLLSACIFTQQRINAQTLAPGVVFISLFIFVLALTVFYLALVYNNRLLPNPASEIRESELDFAQRLRNHRQNT